MASELLYCENCGDIIQASAAESEKHLERFVCSKCLGSEGPRGAAGASAASSSARDEEVPTPNDLNLFSKGTIALRKSMLKKSAATEATPGESVGQPPLQLTGSSPGSGQVSPSGRSPSGASDSGGPLKLRASGTDSEQGATAPAQRARKIVFRCLHCKSTLSIRPVKATSRLTCPFCSNKIYVSASGQLFDRPPSAVVRKGGSQAVPQIGREQVSLDKKGVQPTSSPSKPTSAIVERVPDGSGSPTASRGVGLRREATPTSSGSARSGSSRSSGQGRAAQPPRPSTSSPQPKRPSSAQGLKLVGGGPSASPGGGSSARRKPSPSSVSARKAGGSSSSRPGDDFDFAPDEPQLDALDFDGSPERESRKPARSSSSVKRTEPARGRTEPRPALGHKRDAPTPPSHEGSRLGALVTKAIWGVFLAATLTLPPLLVGGLRYLALRSEGEDAVRSASVPSLFETFGHIARQGFQQVLESYPRNEE